jgi:hypothetical protein
VHGYIHSIALIAILFRNFHVLSIFYKFSRVEISHILYHAKNRMTSKTKREQTP